MKVVVGLGNPGKEYAQTRHNVGFAVIDALVESRAAGPFQDRFSALVAETFDETAKVLFVKPMTYMNRSGESVRRIVDFYKLPLCDLLVVCDDINLELGRLRIRTKGTHGGHNGLRNIQEHLGTTEYPRLRIGVGAPEDDAVDHVLGRFRSNERPIIEEAIARAAEAVGVWVHEGIEQCMNQYNR
ncbi:MAG: peptidyl-tRNA hydrolase [Gemmatales bacterium]|nr:MAG: peptidyl-tRNA hydrolase [Gemmatales bacterium]